MDLMAYMQRFELDNAAMALKIGCSQGAVNKWKYGHVMPTPVSLRKILQATSGLVTADDMLQAFERQVARQAARKARNEDGQ
jgi:DNA-binding transcriptional regulator YdaS (Cro superfamily)